MSTSIQPYRVDVENNVFYLWKNSWQQLDVLVAECIGIDFQEGQAVIDLTLVCPKAFDAFVRWIYDIDEEKSAKFMLSLYEDIMAEVKPIYNAILAEFYEKFSPRFRTHDFEGKIYGLAAHQRDNLPWFIERKNNAMFWEQRSGKTITAAMVSDLENVQKTLVVTSNTAKGSWYKELPRWGFSAYNLTLLAANAKKSQQALMEKYVFVNYDSVAKHTRKWKDNEFGHIVFGECHKIKNRSTDKWKICRAIVDRNPNAKITLETGTPAYNRINDLFAYLSITDHKLGGDYAFFANTFLTFRADGQVRGVKNHELLNVCLSNWSSRYLTSELFDMPKEVHEKVYFEMGDWQAEYDRILDEMYNRSQRGIDLKKQFSAVFDRIAEIEKQIKDSTDLSEQKELRKELLRVQSQNNDIIEEVKLADKQSKGDGSIHSLNRITAMAKVKGIIELAEDTLENTGKLIIFCYYKDALKEIADYFGKRCIVITGDTSDTERSYLEDEFRLNDKIEIILGTTAIAESLDLSAANNIFIVSMPLSPGPLEQVKKRMQNAFKTADKQPIVTISYMIANGTEEEPSIDEILFDLVASKHTDINITVNAGKEVPDMENINGKILSTLLNNYKKKK